MQSNNIFRIILIIFVFVLNRVCIEATRVLLEDIVNESHLVTFSSSYKKVKLTMAYWLEQLTSGPSPKGLGH